MGSDRGRVVVRVVAVGLLAAGLIGGVTLGRMRDSRSADAAAAQVMLADSDELQLVKARENEHAAARARQGEAEGQAATKAAAEARTAASRARTLTRAAVAAKNKPKGPAIPESCNDFVGNRAVGCALMLSSGLGINQFPCLNKLWNRESGWNARASNSGSGAYGIPQALPGSKMASAGPDWKSNPATQIRWGLGYIKGHYKTPCGAWSHSEAVGSY